MTVRHPMVMVAIEHFRQQRGIPTPPTAKLLLTADGGATGDYAFFLYRLNVHALVAETELHAVLVDIATSEVNEAAATDFLARLQRRNDSDPPRIAMESERFEVLKQIAQRHISGVRDLREREIRESNDALVDLRRASLSLSFDFRLDRVQEQLGRALDPNIRRMRQSQRERLLAQRNAKLQALEQKRAVMVDFQMVAQGLVRLVPGLAESRAS